jgi:hypothetical protein
MIPDSPLPEASERSAAGLRVGRRRICACCIIPAGSFEVYILQAAEELRGRQVTHPKHALLLQQTRVPILHQEERRARNPVGLSCPLITGVAGVKGGEAGTAAGESPGTPDRR